MVRMPSPDRHSYSLLSDAVYLRDKADALLTDLDVVQSHLPDDLVSGIISHQIEKLTHTVCL